MSDAKDSPPPAKPPQQDDYALVGSRVISAQTTSIPLFLETANAGLGKDFTSAMTLGLLRRTLDQAEIGAVVPSDPRWEAIKQQQGRAQDQKIPAPDQDKPAWHTRPIRGIASDKVQALRQKLLAVQENSAKRAGAHAELLDFETSTELVWVPSGMDATWKSSKITDTMALVPYEAPKPGDQKTKAPSRRPVRIQEGGKTIEWPLPDVTSGKQIDANSAFLCYLAELKGNEWGADEIRRAAVWYKQIQAQYSFNISVKLAKMPQIARDEEVSARNSKVRSLVYQPVMLD
jgi:hypothetical protein